MQWTWWSNRGTPRQSWCNPRISSKIWGASIDHIDATIIQIHMGNRPIRTRRWSSGEFIISNAKSGSNPNLDQEPKIFRKCSGLSNWGRTALYKYFHSPQRDLWQCQSIKLQSCFLSILNPVKMTLFWVSGIWKGTLELHIASPVWFLVFSWRSPVYNPILICSAFSGSSGSSIPALRCDIHGSIWPFFVS
jgi:hypothetical protein